LTALRDASDDYESLFFPSGKSDSEEAFKSVRVRLLSLWYTLGIDLKQCQEAAMSEPVMTVMSEEAEASERSKVARRGRALYEAQLKAVLEPEYNNRLVAIHPDSGEYVVADPTGNAMRAIRKSRPQGRLYLTKIGPEPEYGPAARILMAGPR